MSAHHGRKVNIDSSESCRIIYCPVAESSEAFQKRRDEVQSIMVRMILLGRKKGRPSTKEEEYEKAA